MANEESNTEYQKLTPIHWELYRFVKEKTLDTEAKVSQREIYEHLNAKGYGVSWNESQNQHNDHCRWLWDLVNEINFSLEVDHIIVHDRDYNYCLGSEDEVLREWFLQYSKSEIAKMRHLRILAKIKQNGQGKLLSNQGVEITEDSLAKLYHETFNGKGKRKEA